MPLINSGNLQQRPIVLQLPNEILIEICRLNADRDKFHGDRTCRCKMYSWRGPHLQDTINASQVCRQWRYALIQCPQLWRNFISPRHPHQEWTRLLLERSSPLGINYISFGPPYFSSNNLKLEVAHGGRLESYWFFFPEHSDIWSSECFPKQWSQLKSLCVYLTWQHQPEGLKGDPQYSLPDNFPCHTSTPQLERLHLHFCFVRSVEQITNMGDTLTELYVQWTARSLAFSIVQWVHIISSLPRLKRLFLDRAVSEYVDAEEEKLNLRPLHQLNLDEFYFQDDIDACVKIMKCFDLTKTTRSFGLLCYDINDDEGHLVEFIVSRISPIITNLLSKQEIFRRCCLHIDDGKFNCMGIPDDCQVQPSWPQTQGEFDGGHVEIDFRFVGEEVPFETFYHAVMRSFQPVCDRIVFLAMSELMGYTLPGVDTFCEILLKNSDHLLGINISMPLWNIIYRYFLHGVERLARLTASGVQHSDGHFLPALQELHMCHQNHGPEPDEGEMQAFYEQIYQFCRHKKAIGYPMCLITVFSPVENEIVGRLGELGVKLLSSGGFTHFLPSLHSALAARH